MSNINLVKGLERIECAVLRDKITTVSKAARMITDGMTVAVSGFTPSGCPKAVPVELARQVNEEGRRVQINLLSGASTGEEIDGLLSRAGIIKRRFPYATNSSFRTAVNSGEIAYQDVHLGSLAQNVRYGQYGDIDIAVIEACKIRADGGIVPTTAVGCIQTYISQAKKVIIEVNVTQPVELEGMHDIYELQDPPDRKPIPLEAAGNRIGRPYAVCSPDKVAAVVISECQEKPRSLTPADENSQWIAGHIVEFLKQERSAGRLSADRVPLQSGVGNVANAVLEGLKTSGFEHLSFYSEVMQDGILSLIDAGIADFCSATSLSLSAPGMKRLMKCLERYRDKIILRDSEISNNAEVIRRLGVIAMNTAIEADIFGNVNSSHMLGTKIYNGLGGSGDYARNSLCSIFMTSSVAKDGKISSIVPMVSHVDHTEHDVDVIVTEQGYAVLYGKSPLERAEAIIENCAHPDYRPMLWKYLEQARWVSEGHHTPHDLRKAMSWHQRFLDTGSMK